MERAMEAAGWIAGAAGLTAGSLIDLKEHSIPLFLPVLTGLAGLFAAAAGLLGPILAAVNSADGVRAAENAAGIAAGAGQNVWTRLLFGLLPGLLMGCAARASRRGIGSGDAAMIAALGLCLPPAVLWTGLMGALLLEGMTGMILYAAKRRPLTKGMPFLPFLWIGTALAGLVQVIARD